MAEFGKSSQKRVDSVHQDWQNILHYAIKILDFSVVGGLRTAEEQFELWKKGRAELNGTWTIVNEGLVVTKKDGYKKKSRHQSGNAVDITPYPGMWNATEAEWRELAGVIKAVAYMLRKYGAIEHEIKWGWDMWKWDRPHWELKL